MSEKEAKVVKEIITVLAKNECTVAQAKLLLSATEKAISEKTTVHSDRDNCNNAHVPTGPSKEWVPGKGWRTGGATTHRGR